MSLSQQYWVKLRSYRGRSPEAAATGSMHGLISGPILATLLNVPISCLNDCRDNKAARSLDIIAALLSCRCEHYVHPVVGGLPGLIRETSGPAISIYPVTAAHVVGQCVQWWIVHSS